MICPCKDCEKRTITCHSNCEPYLEYVIWRRKINEKEREEKKLDYSINERRRKWKTKN